MRREIEISALDLRYERCRLRHLATEKALLSSIIENGVRDDLLGVSSKDNNHILLDGFKRMRCLKIIGTSVAPYSSLNEDEACWILELLRISLSKHLNILEQAQLINELKSIHGLSVSEIATRLERSKGWVSMRSGLIEEISDVVKEKIFAGKFPVYSYMYTLRQFMRMNTVKKNDINDFVQSVSGKGLSVRDIERLAFGYFKGPEHFRSQILRGDVGWGLKHLQEISYSPEDCSDFEQAMLSDLEIVEKYIEKVTYKSIETKLSSASFFAQAGLLVKNILGKSDSFLKAMGDLYDRSGKV